MAQQPTPRTLKSLLATEEREQRLVDAHAKHRRKGLHLSWKEATAGEECRGCWTPLRTDAQFESIHEATPEQRMARWHEGREFKAAHHPDCYGSAWNWGNNVTWHCYECCPQPPTHPDQLAQGWRQFSRLRKNRSAAHLHRLQLTCGHVVEASSSVDTATLSGTRTCFQCNRIRSIVSSEIIERAENAVREKISTVQRQIEQAEREERAATRRAKKLAKEAAELRRQLKATNDGNGTPA